MVIVHLPVEKEVRAHSIRRGGWTADRKEVLRHVWEAVWMRKLVRLAAALLIGLCSSTTGAAPFEAARTIAGAQFETTGQVTMVHFWATWCAPCRLEMPILDAFYRKHHAQGLTMLAVSIDEGISTKKLEDVTSKFAFPVARVDDVKMPRRDIPRALPVTRVYDRAGKLVFQTKGDGRTILDEATLERVVSPLLASH